MTAAPAKWRLGALVVGCIAMVVIALLASNAPIGEVVQRLLFDSFSSPSAAMETLKRFCPYVIVGAAVFWGFRAGLFNIGVEGQFLMGGLVATIAAVEVGGIVGTVVGILAGTIAGALWVLPAAWIRAYRGGHEVISTIMLNQIAILLASHLVSGPLMDKNAGFPTTPSVKPAAMISGIPIGAVTVSWAILIAVLVLAAFSWWLKSTVSGFELTATGANSTAARFAGVEVKKTLVSALCGSGAMAGFGGALQSAAFEGRFFDGFSAGYGFDALGVAILAGTNPLAIIPSALAFSILGQGATAVQINGVPKGLSGVILALLIVVFAAFRYSRRPTQDA